MIAINPGGLSHVSSHVARKSCPIHLTEFRMALNDGSVRTVSEDDARALGARLPPGVVVGHVKGAHQSGQLPG